MRQSLKKHGVLLLVALLTASLLAACASPAPKDSSDDPNAGAPAGNASIDALPDVVTAEDLDDSFDESTATKINFSGSSAAIDGAGAAANGNAVTITKAGTYILSGGADDMQLIIDAGDSDLVRLVMNGVSLTSKSSAPIYAKNARKVVVILPDDSENALTDAMEYVYSTAAEDEPDAALFSKTDLTINGNGTLNVNANFYNGIGTKDDLIIVSGNHTVNAANNAIRGRDSAVFLDGGFHLTAGNDGIQSNNDTSKDQGWIQIRGGDYTIVSGYDGIQAETVLQIDAGIFDITAGGGASANAPAATSTEEESNSYKGIKANGNIAINGGAFTIDSLDDAVHSNAGVSVTGGDFIIATGDDGFHADSHLAISGGAIDIQKSYEGLEGATIEIGGGTIDIVALDDGVNAAGGSSDSGQGMFGADRFSASGDYWINLSGGVIHVNANGDGIDSNGNIMMGGGELYVSGSTDGGNSALDFDGSFDMTGGTLFAAGMSQMAQSVTTSSTPTIMVYFSSQIAADSTVDVLDGSGNTVISCAVPKAFNNLIVNSNLTSGASYSIRVNGEVIVTKTLADGLNSFDESGNAVSGGTGMGGGNRPNGGQGMTMQDFPPDGLTPPENNMTFPGQAP